MLNSPNLKDATRIGRSSVPKAPEFQELYDFDREAKTIIEATFPYETQVHRAHVVMLSERSILTVEEAAAILRGLTIVDEKANSDVSLRTYLPYEAALKRIAGPVGGKMHLGRSRNDLANTVGRMFLRDQLNRTIEAIVLLRQAVVEKAAEHLQTVMVVYTQRKEAQPITLAHYLMAISESLSKSIARYEQLYVRMNQCPLGSAATAGTGWPLDRTRTSHLLGFDALVVNTIEGVAGWDHVAEFAANNAIYLSGLSRLASEIQLWTTDEYQIAELDASFAGASSIMPQKKNPDSLERIRQVAASSMGPLVAILTSLNAVEYQYSAARVGLEPRSLDSLIAATHAMSGVVRTLHANELQMLRYATENFATMTDLTDAVVREAGLDYREAHEVIARVVDTAKEQRKTADQIDMDMVQRAAMDQVGHELKILPQAVFDALDPMKNVRRRDGIGGPAPAAVQRTIDDALAEIGDHMTRLDLRRQRLSASADELSQAVATIIDNPLTEPAGH
ncbi:argininosuccinate lyase [Paraburkholderia strydomiana]|uniref:argininosuccinate lyase n=1 Tax=Paraburkholderia strydomiana TaxID=1245417 RepID=UPI0028587A1A|nr:argininosuccinate lyase [Paraburkholderia strydomiana]MDR7010043.1 argininosuccinate lyase [Paraburkholderia strydomiana]